MAKDFFITPASALAELINSTGTTTASITLDSNDNFTVNSGVLTITGAKFGFNIPTPTYQYHFKTASAGGYPIASSAIDLFTIENNTDTHLHFISPRSSSVGLYFSNPGTGGAGKLLYNLNTDLMTFDTSGTTAMSINCAGRVGIGTSSPTATLHVLGTNLPTGLNASVTGFSFQIPNSNASYIDFVEKRGITGSDWTTANTRIQKRIDAVNQAYI